MENPFHILEQQIIQLQGMVGQLLARPVETKPVVERPIDIDAASSILLMAVKTIYQNIDRIPHHKRHGKLYFFESELLSYIRDKPPAPATTIKQASSRKRTRKDSTPQ